MPKDYYKESGARKGLAGALKDLVEAASPKATLDPEGRRKKWAIDPEGAMADAKARQHTDRHNSY